MVPTEATSTNQMLLSGPTTIPVGADVDEIGYSFNCGPSSTYLLFCIAPLPSLAETAKLQYPALENGAAIPPMP